MTSQPQPDQRDTKELTEVGMLDNKVAIVTGAGQGIGKAIAARGGVTGRKGRAGFTRGAAHRPTGT